MSAESQIVDAILVDVASVVSGVTALRSQDQIDTRPDSDYPLVIVIQTDYDVEPIEWNQEQRTWTVSCALVQIGGTRDTMETKLEAIRNKILEDSTLDNAVDIAYCVSSIPEAHPDDRRIAGVFVVNAERAE